MRRPSQNGWLALAALALALIGSGYLVQLAFSLSLNPGAALNSALRADYGADARLAIAPLQPRVIAEAVRDQQIRAGIVAAPLPIATAAPTPS
ncbi:MAG TPA: hypothetical protein VGE07_02515, partial [Herpetosiphonaceae bacterium]